MKLNQPIKLLLSSLGLALLSSIHLSHALPEDSSLPIQITADEVNYDQQTGEGVYKNNVIMTQGSLEIRADIAKFIMENNALSYVEAKGNLIKIKYLPEKDKPWVLGEGRTLEYYPNQNRLILKTDAKLVQEKDTVVADQIEYDTIAKKVKAHGKSKSDRVFFEIQPNKNK